MANWTTTSAMAVALGLSVLESGCGDSSKDGGPTGIGPPPGLAACSAGPFLTVPLVAASSIQVVAPLGNLNPPGHTFPTDHIYLYMAVFPVAISAPGNLVITDVLVQHRTGGGQADLDDYAVTFFPCSDVMMQLAHVARLATQLSAKVGDLSGGCGSSYQLAGFTYQQCRKSVNVAMSTGEVMGTTAATLDVLARDRRITIAYVNASRLSDSVGAFGDKHVACPIDYFEASIADPLRAKLGIGSALRTTPPVCGDVAQDVPNTAAGRWFRIGSPTYPEEPHLALVHDNFNPALGVFSVGSSIPSLSARTYTFTPAATGRVNLDFRYVTTIGETECYVVSANQRVLLQLTSTTRLRIQGIGPGTCGDPSTWILGAGAVEFER
ncbi:MAG: hypothetical protein IPP90_13440 [Gemmatimonadaceae bacterium]|nr:hypothetical protein [Gemmatimonadaceae bacterium]